MAVDGDVVIKCFDVPHEGTFLFEFCDTQHPTVIGTCAIRVEGVNFVSVAHEEVRHVKYNGCFVVVPTLDVEVFDDSSHV